MKTTATPEQLRAIVAAVESINVKLFSHESGAPTNNAQRNLCGRTHYVDADTLKWHKSRVLSTAILADGLLFRITESCALDFNNTARGFPCVVFDVFGTVVSRNARENTFKTSEAARKASDREEIDLVAHYRAAMESKLHWLEQDTAKMRDALVTLASVPPIESNTIILAEKRGDYITGINWQRDGKAEIMGGSREDAIRFTAAEAQEVIEALTAANGRGYGAEAANE